MSSRQASTRFGAMKRISMLRRSVIDCSRACRSTPVSCELPLSLRAASTTPGSTARAPASSVATTIEMIKTSSRVKPRSFSRLRMYVALPRPCTVVGSNLSNERTNATRHRPAPFQGRTGADVLTKVSGYVQGCRADGAPGASLCLRQHARIGLADRRQHPGGALLEVAVHEAGEAGVLAASTGDGSEEPVIGVVEHPDRHVV